MVIYNNKYITLRYENYISGYSFFVYPVFN